MPTEIERKIENYGHDFILSVHKNYWDSGLRAVCYLQELGPQYKNKSTLYRLRVKKGPAPPPPPLGNFADISYLEDNFKPHLLRDVYTLCSGALVSDSLLHMLL